MTGMGLEAGTGKLLRRERRRLAPSFSVEQLMQRGDLRIDLVPGHNLHDSNFARGFIADRYPIRVHVGSSTPEIVVCKLSSGAYTNMVDRQRQ